MMTAASILYWYTIIQGFIANVKFNGLVLRVKTRPFSLFTSCKLQLVIIYGSDRTCRGLRILNLMLIRYLFLNEAGSLRYNKIMSFPQHILVPESNKAPNPARTRLIVEWFDVAINKWTLATPLNKEIQFGKQNQKIPENVKLGQ